VRLGFLVNPLAGIGGPLALKGSDGDAARAALAAADCGGPAQARAARAVTGLREPLLTCGGAMGADAATAAGVPHQIVHHGAAVSSAADSIAAASALMAAGAELIVFVGGDGTARDLASLNLPIPVLGVPAGVKMHSAVFAPSPASAAAAIADLAAVPACRIVSAEVLDRDAAGQLQLYGTLRVPAAAPRQPAKASAGNADADLEAAITRAADALRDKALAIVGPGLTMYQLKTVLGGSGTLMGVDAYAHGVPVALDADASCLLKLAAAAPPALALGVVGGQAYLLGRGNQQLSTALIRRALWPPIVIASAAKLAALPAGRLLVDTGCEALDQALSGRHIAVHTAPRRTMMMRIDAA
jgi:predicted polyphosphate/ATP-dependent NAD kinase